MALSRIEIKRYKQIGHSLKPCILVGQHGVSENLIDETNRALNDHELIKIKVHSEDREEKNHYIQALAEETESEIVNIIGKTALLFRLAKKPNEKLSNIR